MFLKVTIIAAVLFFQGITAFAKDVDVEEVSICTLRFAGVIQDESADAFISRIETECLSEDRLDIHVMSGGGSEQAAFVLYRYLRHWSGGVDTHAIGQVASSAVPVFLAGEHRRISSLAYMLVHPAAAEVMTTVDVRWLREQASMFAHNDAIYLSIVAERTGLDGRVVNELNQNSEVISAEQAVSLGFAHSVVD